MWVKERNERKNKEKCVNRAIVPDTAAQRYNRGFKRIKRGSAIAPYPDPATIYRRSALCDPADDMFEDVYLSDL